MAHDASEVLKEAMQLPPEARAALAGALIDSLDNHVDEDAEEEWNTEIQRRLDELDTGALNAVPWSEAREQILGGSWSR